MTPWLVVAHIQPGRPLPHETVPTEGGILSPTEAHYLALLIDQRTPGSACWQATFFASTNMPAEVAGLLERGEIRPRHRTFHAEPDGLLVRVTPKGWVTARLLELY